MTGKTPMAIHRRTGKALAWAASAAEQTVVVEQAALLSLTEPVYLGPILRVTWQTTHSFVNHLDDFKASHADIFVDGGVMNTFIVGQGTVEDHGVGTVIVPVAGGGEGKDKDDH